MCQDPPPAEPGVRRGAGKARASSRGLRRAHIPQLSAALGDGDHLTKVRVEQGQVGFHQD